MTGDPLLWTPGGIPMEIQPLGERVLLRKLETEERTAGGLYVPDSVREGKKQGIVEAVGTYTDLERHGEKVGKPLPLQKGDRVLYGGYSSEEFEMNDETYLIIEYKDILAKLR